MNTKFKTFIRYIILIIAVPVFILSFLSFYSSIKEYYLNNKLYTDIEYLNPIDDNSDDLSKNYNKLNEINTDYICWISIPNTKINYPVVKGIDNSFYLNHNFLKDESKAGAIFIDYRCTPLEDKNTIIYGHYMKDGSMFAGLQSISKNSLEPSEIYIATKSQVLVYQIFSIIKEEANANSYETFWSTEDDYLNYINTLKNRSIINYNVSLNESDNIITLSTCDYNYNNGRLLVIAKLVN